MDNLTLPMFLIILCSITACVTVIGSNNEVTINGLKVDVELEKSNKVKKTKDVRQREDNGK